MSAYIEDSKIVQKKHIINALKSLSSEEIKNSRKTSILIAVSSIFIIFLLLIYLNFYTNTSSENLTKEKNVRFSSDFNNEIFAIVTVGEANLRLSPNVNAKRIGTITKGGKLKVTGESHDKNGIKWYKVKVFDTKEAWISEKTVKIVKP